MDFGAFKVHQKCMDSMRGLGLRASATGPRLFLMTYIADLDPNNSDTLAREAYADMFSAEFPDWEIREGYGVRYLSERDMPAEDASADESQMTAEDWETMAEALWSDPAERDY